jgi:hypothetical protein
MSNVTEEIKIVYFAFPFFTSLRCCRLLHSFPARALLTGISIAIAIAIRISVGVSISHRSRRSSVKLCQQTVPVLLPE